MEVGVVEKSWEGSSEIATIVFIKTVKESITVKQTEVYDMLYSGNMFRYNVVSFRPIL